MKTIRLLTVGNSFSANALRFLSDIADSSGLVKFDVAKASLSGCSLEKHFNLAKLSERMPDFPMYAVGAVDGIMQEMSLVKALAWKRWDFVTLQQVSRKSFLRETFEPYLGELVSLVGALAPQARIMLHQTWAYRVDSPFYPENGITQKIMHARIAENYQHFAAKYGCGVIPSGEAVDLARRSAGRAFTWPDEDFDYQHSKPPALPRQCNSLAVGWYWAITSSPDGQGELRLDASHLNDRGRYLAGATWFERLTGLDVRETSFVPWGIEEDDAAFLREIAHEAVARHE